MRTSAISRSIRNLVLTNFYERPHQPRKGSNTSAKLFENFTPNILTELRENIESVIENHESRAEVRDIVITRSGQYGVNIRIEYKSKVSNDESVVDVFLKRVI